MKKWFLILLLVTAVSHGQWQPDVRLTSDTANSYTSVNNAWAIATSGNVVHVLWYDFRDGNYEIYYKRSTDAGISWGADTRLTNASGDSQFPSVSVSGSVVHVVWYDNRDGNNEIYYKRNPTGNPIGIININSEIPNQYSLSQNYPNPFNPTTVIKFQVASLSSVKLTVFDVLGNEIETLVNEQLTTGTYEVDFDGSSFTSGVYYYKLTAGDYTETEKMVLIK
ncbi:MAG: T9SS type A sorting domain-containing protein [Ginsengibacter sp.]